MKIKYFSKRSVFFSFFCVAALIIIGATYVYYFNHPLQQDLLLLFLLLCAVGLIFFVLILGYLLNQKHRTQQLLYKTAYIDPITQGPTWSKAKQTIPLLLEQNPQETFAFVIFDINKFKLLNERLGYLKANDVLRHIGFIIKENLQTSEIFCRVQADVFQLLLTYRSAEQLKNRLEILSEEIIRTLPIEKNRFQMILSFGVYFITEPITSLNELLVKAALARDTIKGKYNNIVGFYNEDLKKQFQLEQEIENHMEDALYHEKFELNLAPIQNMKGALYGAEAFLRWKLDGYGEIPPDIFRKVFTKNGFIHRLDLYTAEKICQFQKQRIQDKKDLFPVFINLSSDSLRSPQFASSLLRLLRQYQIDSNLLILQAAPQNEISQTDIISGMAHRLREKGFTLSLDQAGKGYSSLELLKILPLQIVKIEEDAVSDLENNERARRLAQSLIYMAEQLKVKIIFGGVSTQKQKDILKNLGADFIMGPVIAKTVL